MPPIPRPARSVHRPYVRSRLLWTWAALKARRTATEGSLMPAGILSMRARMRGQEGFTLVELLLAMGISLVVAAGALTLVDIEIGRAHV